PQCPVLLPRLGPTPPGFPGSRPEPPRAASTTLAGWVDPLHADGYLGAASALELAPGSPCCRQTTREHAVETCPLPSRRPAVPRHCGPPRGIPIEGDDLR